MTAALPAPLSPETFERYRRLIHAKKGIWMRNGADAVRELHRLGGRVLARDQDSSVIFGMNHEVIQNGDADEVLPLERIGHRLGALTSAGFPARRTT